MYDIEKSGIDSLIIEQHNLGLECDAVGSLGNGWHLRLAASWLDAEIADSFEPEFIGNRPRISPKHTASLWLSRDLVLNNDWRARIGLGYQTVGKRFISAENNTLLDAYHLVDAGVTVEYGDHLTIGVLLRNAFDEAYTLGVFNALPFWTNPGQGRTLESSLTYRF